MKSKLTIAALCFMLVFAAYSPAARAETTTPATTLLETLKTLMAKIADLKAQLAELRGEVSDAIKDGLVEGMTDEDIKEIQEVLASDPSIYPEGKVTGYFGPLTKRAIERFQKKFNLEVTGTVDDETQAALEEILKARFGEGKVPAGLLAAPGIREKFERRLELGCDNSGTGKAPFCLKMKTKYKFDDDDDADDDDSSDDVGLSEAEATIYTNETLVKIELDGEKSMLTTTKTSRVDLVALIVAEYDLTEDEVDDILSIEEEDRASRDSDKDWADDENESEDDDTDESDDDDDDTEDDEDDSDDDDDDN